MDQKNYDTVIIGGGAAGMAAAVSVSEEGLSAAIIDREDNIETYPFLDKKKVAFFIINKILSFLPLKR